MMPAVKRAVALNDLYALIVCQITIDVIGGMFDHAILLGLIVTCLLSQVNQVRIIRDIYLL